MKSLNENALFVFSLFFVVSCGIALFWILLSPLPTSSVENQVNQFIKSSDSKTPADVLFPSEWNYLCVIGPYANFETFQQDMGRPITFKEQLMWIRYGVDGESELNLVFEVNNEIVNIERYHLLSAPQFDMQFAPSRGKCIDRSENILFVKKFSEFDERKVYSLMARTTK